MFVARMDSIKSLFVMCIIFFACLMFFCSCHCEWFTYDRAIADAQRQDYDSALQRLHTKLIDQPDNPSLLYDTGVVSYKSGDYKQAQDYFKRAAQAKNIEVPLQKNAHFNFGNACCALKEYKDAIGAYEQALKLDPHDERVQHNLKKAKELLAAQQKQQEQQKQDQKQEQKQQGQSQQNQEQDAQEKQSQEQKSQEKKNDEGQNGSQEQGKQSHDKKQQGEQGQSSGQDEKQQGSEQQEGQGKADGKNSERGKQQEQGGGSEKSDHKQGKQADDAEKQEQGNQGHEQEAKRKPARTDGNNADNAGREQTFNDHDQSPQDQLKQHTSRPYDMQPGPAMQAMQVQQGQKQASRGAQQQEKKIDARLMWIMQEQERKDTERSKGLIKGMIGEQLVGQDGQHCW
jgi:tetratricopeptide (TPR) repeat protein